MTPLNILPLTRVSESSPSRGDHVEWLLAEPLQPSSVGPEQGNTLCWDPRTPNYPMFEGHWAFPADVKCKEIAPLNKLRLSPRGYSYQLKRNRISMR